MGNISISQTFPSLIHSPTDSLSSVTLRLSSRHRGQKPLNRSLQTPFLSQHSCSAIPYSINSTHQQHLLDLYVPLSSLTLTHSPLGLSHHRNNSTVCYASVEVVHTRHQLSTFFLLSISSSRLSFSVSASLFLSIILLFYPSIYLSISLKSQLHITYRSLEHLFT